MHTYLKALKKVVTSGKRRGDRTGVGTCGLFGDQYRFDLNKGFPILTTKEVHWHSVVHELLWFIAGRTDVKWLQDRNVRIWNEWATEEQCAKFDRPAGQLGPIYGHQWRNFGASVAPASVSKAFITLAKGVDAPLTYSHRDKEGNDLVFMKDGFDQLKWLVNEIKTNPFSRRLILTGWNPREANMVCLPPCHTLAQFYVDEDPVKGYRLSCQLYQRSADVFLGVPFNIASYALLTHLIAQVCKMGVGELVWTVGDLHLYSNHFEAAHKQLARLPSDRPLLKLDPSVEDLFVFRPEHIQLEDYSHQGKISAPVAV